MSDNKYLFVPDDDGDYFYEVVIKVDMTQIQFSVRQFDKEDSTMLQSEPGPKFQRFKSND